LLLHYFTNNNNFSFTQTKHPI